MAQHSWFWNHTLVKNWDWIAKRATAGSYWAIFFVWPKRIVSDCNRAKDGSTCVFFNSYNFEPAKSGARSIIALQWVIIHTFLAKFVLGLTALTFRSSSAVADGISLCGQAADISYAKFFPAVQRPILQSMQVRFAQISCPKYTSPFCQWGWRHFISLMHRWYSVYCGELYLFGCRQKWSAGWVNLLTAALTRKVHMLDSTGLSEFVDKEMVPSFLSGQMQEQDHFDQWVEYLKEFYESQLQPAWTNLVKGEQKNPMDTDLWEPPAEKHWRIFWNIDTVLVTLHMLDSKITHCLLK